MPLTDGSGFSLLPTPVSSDAHRRQHLAKTGGGDNLITAIIRAELNDTWHTYRPAIQRWELALARPAPPPTDLNKHGRPRVNVAFVEWMMGWPEGWVTDTATSRLDQLWILGNGVVPQQAKLAIDAVGIVY